MPSAEKLMLSSEFWKLVDPWSPDVLKPSAKTVTTPSGWMRRIAAADRSPPPTALPFVMVGGGAAGPVVLDADGAVALHGDVNRGHVGDAVGGLRGHQLLLAARQVGHEQAARVLRRAMVNVVPLEVTVLPTLPVFVPVVVFPVVVVVEAVSVKPCEK